MIMLFVVFSLSPLKAMLCNLDFNLYLFTGQKEVNNKIYTTYSDLYRKSFPNFDSPENVPQYRQISLECSGKVSAQSNG